MPNTYAPPAISLFASKAPPAIARYQFRLNRLKGRIIALHVKDTAPDGKITDVGAGVIDWTRVYEAAGPGVKYYIWEYDGAPEPMKNAEIAYKYMRCLK